MKARKVAFVLLLVYGITLAIRLFFAYHTPNFSDDSAYFALRQVDNIKNTGLPLIYDGLSYGGRSLYYMPLFYYILAMFNFILPAVAVGKIIPNIFASSLVFVVYFISKHLTKNTNIALFTSAVSTFVPVYFAKTVNSISPLSLVVPVMFMAVYFVMKMYRDPEYANYAVALIVVLSFLHPTSFLFVIALLFYVILLKIEKLNLHDSDLEVVIFATFLIFLTQFILFKKALLVHGADVIWQNIPDIALSEFFKDFTILGSISAIGIVPFLFGIFAVYKYTLREKLVSIYLLLGFVLAIALLLWFKLIPFEAGLIFFGVILVLLFSQALRLAQGYIPKTRFACMYPTFTVLIVILLVATSVVPALSYGAREVLNAYNEDDIRAMSWVRDNTGESATVLASPDRGHFISYFSRRNVMDKDYLLVADASGRLDDIYNIYKSHSETEVVRMLNKYNVSYVVFSDDEKEKFGIDKLSYEDDERCFELVYNETYSFARLNDNNNKNSSNDSIRTYKIFKVLCRLEENA